MKKNCLYLLLIFLMASCVTSRKVNLMQEPSRNIPTYEDTLSYVDYKLQKGDRLYVRVYSIDEKISSLFNGGVTNMNQFVRQGSSGPTVDLYTYVIDDNGNIVFPTIGEVPVLGLTTREVKHALEKGLSSIIVQHGNMPNLSVEVQIVQRYFSVISSGGSGRFAINKEKVTIFEAIAMAGDIAEFSDRSNIQIIREQGDSTIIKKFDIRSADIINSEYYYVEPNDVIYIPKITGQAFGLNSASATISVVASTLSFGVFIYTLVDRFIINPIQEHNATLNTQP